MRAVIQRVSRASVSVNDAIVSAIGPGLLVLLGVAEGDTEAEARWLAHKSVNLRIFADSNGRMNLSVQDVGGEVLVISQFTLLGDIRRGFRPSFTKAASPQQASALIDLFCDALRDEQLHVATGIFGAHMQVALLNDGPVTILLEKTP